MKQLLLIMAVIAICSCSNSSTITKEKSIPVEVAKMSSVGAFDTLTAITTNDYIYIFEKGEYKESIVKQQSDVAAFWVGIIFGVMIGSIITGVLVGRG